MHSKICCDYPATTAPVPYALQDLLWLSSYNCTCTLCTPRSAVIIQLQLHLYPMHSKICCDYPATTAPVPYALQDLLWLSSYNCTCTLCTPRSAVIIQLQLHLYPMHSKICCDYPATTAPVPYALQDLLWLSSYNCTCTLCTPRSAVIIQLQLHLYPMHSKICCDYPATTAPVPYALQDLLWLSSYNCTCTLCTPRSAVIIQLQLHLYPMHSKICCDYPATTAPVPYALQDLLWLSSPRAQAWKHIMSAQNSILSGSSSKSNLPLSHSPDRKIFPFKKGFKKLPAISTLGFFGFFFLGWTPPPKQKIVPATLYAPLRSALRFPGSWLTVDARHHLVRTPSNMAARIVYRYLILLF